MQQHSQRGFALVVTLSLMILLTVIAVGLLSLSSISLRSSSQSFSMATARANARLALILAIGDLQKFAGPDQRITARADVTDKNVSNPRLTGVWKSWDIKASSPPSASDYEKSARDGKFVGWLASSLDGKAASQIGFANNKLSSTDAAKVATLWGPGSLGAGSPAADIVLATKIPTSPSRGALAWAVMDEGVKVRMNTPYVEAATLAGMKSTQLGSGQSPDFASMPGPDPVADRDKRPLAGLSRTYFKQGSSEFAALEKGISPLNMGLAAETLATGTGVALKTLSHDVTSASVGLFTDTATGGLKEDFSLLSNTATLPAPYSGAGVYASRLGMTAADVPSDPRWESLSQFARLYIDSTRLSKTGDLPFLKAQGPTGWKAVDGSDPVTGKQGTLVRTPPAGVVLMPTIAKVQVIFSLLTRDIYAYPKKSDTTPKVPGTKAEETTAATVHPYWAKQWAGSSYDYMLHLLYTPVVTLHNPYNVALEFNELKVVFGTVPFSLQVWRNGEKQSSALVPLDQMYESNDKAKASKVFGMTLYTKSASGGAGQPTFRLLPGEVMMFSPYIDPQLSWAAEQAGAANFSDWMNDKKTSTIRGIPGWRGDGLGFDLDYFAPTDFRISSVEIENGVSMARNGTIGARAVDEFHLLFAPLSVEKLSKNKFSIEMFSKATSNSPFVSSGAIEMDYEKPTGLQDALLGAGGTIRFPKSGTINTMDMHSHATTQIKEIATAKPFAVISAQAKATMGGLNPDGEDGRLATKPWCFAHASIGSSSTKISSEGSANASHEIDFQRLENGTLNLLQFEPATGRGNSITGQTGNTGQKFGVQYDIPLAPIQSLSSLNGANPGGSSGYLPRFAQPIGNSWAHPLMDSDKLMQTQTGGNYLDHSFLLNLALYDHFYFSGLSDQKGIFSNTGKATSSLVSDFIAGKPLTDPRLSLYTPDGKPVTALAGEMSAAQAHTKIASWQVMNGAFNINSTSVAAWKGMLGSIRDSQAIANRINKAGKTSSLATLSPTGSGESRISRFRLPASDSEADGGDPKDAYWLGAREYSDAQIQTLAEKIVDQVRLRGPFLSMSEFVNRRLGTGQAAQRGALQQAIDNSDLNKSLADGAGAGFEIESAMVKDHHYRNQSAGTGASYQGAPGYLTQADLLTVLGNAATARSDTFTIRGYGEARDVTNKVTAAATCEAIIQRVPDYIDPADKAEIAPLALTSNINKVFGRRFQLVSFRWLAQNEI